MPPFRFSLEQVLKYRTRLEDQAKVELSRVEQERQQAQAQVDMLEVTLVQQETALMVLRIDETAQRWLIESFLKGVRLDLSMARKRVRNWDKVVEVARQELMNRARDKKALEKLKETRKETHAEDEKYREQKEFDETASVRFKASH